jgi:hypothetical protein
MNELTSRQRNGLRVLYCSGLCAMFVLALLPTGGSEPWFAHQDKVEHALLFAVITLSALWLWPDAPIAVPRLLLGYGIAMEIAQAQTVHRTGDLLDLAADAAGIVIAWLCWRRWQRRTQSRV